MLTESIFGERRRPDVFVIYDNASDIQRMQFKPNLVKLVLELVADYPTPCRKCACRLCGC